MAEFEITLSEEDTERLAEKVASRLQERMTSGEGLEGYFVPMLMTSKQVAKVLGRPLTAVQALITRREIPAIRFGDKTIRVDPRDLDAYIKVHADDPDRRRRLQEWTESQSAEVYHIGG